MTAQPCTCSQTRGAHCPAHGSDAHTPPAGSSPETAERLRQLAEQRDRGQQPTEPTSR